MGASKNTFTEIREETMAEQSFIPSVSSRIADHVVPIELSKASAEGNAEQIAELVKSGEANALDVSTKLAWIISTCEQARKLIQSDAVDEIEKHNGKTTVNGAEVIKKETGAKYDYSVCADSEWERCSVEEKSAAEKRKEREKFLKTLTKPLTIANEETGEMETLNPPIKSSQTNIQISFQ